jgi:tetratricopeptide (TPR) repeat protein
VNTERVRLEDQLEQVESDLVDLDDQVDAGEIDAATAEQLRTGYAAEAESLRSRLAEDSLETAAVDEEPAASADGAPRTRSRARLVAGAAILAVGAVVIAAVVVVSANSGTSNVVAGVPGEVLGDDGVDLSEVSNEEMEEVVAANPGVVGMRLALARRYFEAGDFGPALDHYMTVLDQEQHPEALANVGWMTYLSDRPEVALAYVERALELEPDFAQAYWFLANIRFALGDAEGAVEPLERLLAYEGLPEDIRTEAEDALAGLRAGS